MLLRSTPSCTSSQSGLISLNFVTCLTVSSTALSTSAAVVNLPSPNLQPQVQLLTDNMTKFWRQQCISWASQATFDNISAHCMSSHPLSEECVFAITDSPQSICQRNGADMKQLDLQLEAALPLSQDKNLGYKQMWLRLISQPT